MTRASTVSIRVLAAAGLAYAIQAAVTRPLTIEEARLWADLIRPSLRASLVAPDAWSAFLYALVAERFIGVLRLSEFSLRLPSLLAGGVCAWAVWRSRSVWTAVAYAGATAVGWFSTAQGHGIATALCLASPNPSGWRLGVAIAFSPAFAIILGIYWRMRDIERITIPAVATAFLLLLIPASHAGPASSGDPRPDFQRERNRRNAARVVVFSHLSRDSTL